MSESFLVIELNQQPVELCKLLKIADLVSGGGEAKIVISEGYVLLNGEVEFQKRKKIYHQDVIQFNGEVVQLMINEHLSEQVNSSPVNETSTEFSALVSKNKEKIGDNNRDSLSKNTDLKHNANREADIPTKGVPSAKSLTPNNSIPPKKRKPISF